MNTVRTNTAVVTRNTIALERLTNDIRRYKVMDVEEEVSAFERYAAAKSESERQAIKAEVINANLRFALSIAKKYAKDGDKIAELVSVATIGMSRAFDTFDVSMGFKFISHAIHWIRAEFNVFFNTDNNIVRQSNSFKVGSKGKKIAERIIQSEQREPTEEEILEALESEYGIKVKAVDVINVRKSSIDERISSEDDATVADSGEFAMATASRNDYEREIERESITDMVSRLIGILPVREQDIVKKYFGIGYEHEYDMETIAAEYGYSAERIRQIIMNTALPKLRKAAKRIAVA